MGEIMKRLRFHYKSILIALIAVFIFFCYAYTAFYKKSVLILCSCILSLILINIIAVTGCKPIHKNLSKLQILAIIILELTIVTLLAVFLFLFFGGKGVSTYIVPRASIFLGLLGFLFYGIVYIKKVSAEKQGEKQNPDCNMNGDSKNWAKFTQKKNWIGY